MKYRRNKVKREHGIIQDALNWLEELGQCPEVTDIIPGVIEVSRSPERCIVYKYPTQTGCKLLLKSNGSIQEAFVVTKEPEIVREWVERHFPPTIEKVEQVRPEHHAQSEIKSSGNPLKDKLNTRRPYSDKATKSSKNRRPGNAETLKLGNVDPLNLGQLLNSNTRQALRALQKDLCDSSKFQRKKT
ncbi:DUF2103 domain-containing protein [Desulfitobacterium metallireducens]|uniref:Metal-binding protein n=1 Tax=Desulfitobacterium metallireducens DSM 15288 TaxID=871968 RepID=W0E7I1_9FIRM|nr:DUF2103 domain-containing protein [Desulfitobacterium metallireducens]AHF06717.1 hypothetical protein DESME_06330 [Desulfitobacterium metallireducens DSM 15288]